MTFLPIVERELRVAARLAATYRNRSLLVAAVSCVALVMLVFGVFASAPSEVGRSMFWTLNLLALVFCVLEGVRKTADCLSEEKREGTLGLLFLTDLKGYDVILGKLAATSLNSFYGLLSLLPILALPLLLGGVTAGEFWRVALSLVNILFFSLATGMWVSARSRQGNSGMSAALFLIALVMVVPMFVPRQVLSAVSPARAFFGGSAKGYLLAPDIYWRSLEITQAMSWALLLWASLVVPYSWCDDNIVTTGPRWFRRKRAELSTPSGRRAALRTTAKSSARAAQRASRRAQMLDINPAYWLAARGSGSRVTMSICVGLAAIGALTLVLSGLMFGLNGNVPVFAITALGFLLLNFVLKLRVAAQSCRSLAEARRNLALEMLLVTPLSVEQIVRGQILALKRIFLVPLTTILALEVAGTIGGMFVAFQWSRGNRAQILDEFFGGTFFVGIVLVLVLLFILDIYAVVWAGLWFGLSSKTESGAITKTIFFALLLPMFCGILACYGLPFVIGIPIFWIAWGGQQLRHEFRRLAAQRYAPNPTEAAWKAPSPNLQAPGKPQPPIIK